MLPRTTDIDAPLIRPSPPVHSPAASPPPVSPIAAQMTGTEGTLSKMVRQSLFHGRTLNRFSSFVVGGAESWIIDGPPDQDTGSSTPSTAGHARLRSTDSDLSASDYRAEARARGISEADLHFIDVRCTCATHRCVLH
jgi:sorting nexin-9/18/33